MKEMKMANYLVQLRQAREQARRDWERYVERGYQEVALGVLRSPDGAEEVHFEMP